MIGKQKLEPEISKEFQRWSGKITDDPKSEESYPISIRDVLRAHFLIANYFFLEGEGIGGIGPKSLDSLYSTLARQVVSLNETKKWNNPIDIAATLFYGLIKNHPFHDGNKRTALLVLLFNMEKIGRWPTAQHKDYENLTVQVAANEIPQNFKNYYKKFEKLGDPVIRCISLFMAKNTRKVDKRHYSLTYRQLNTILSKHGFEMANPQGNKIEILEKKLERGFLGFGKERMVKKRFAVMNFPGWTKQVDKATIAKVREATGLTEEKGCDAQIFYKDADPLETLIDEYRGPLLRLADK